MAWIEPVTDRVAGSRTTAEDLNRICNNLIEKGFTLSKANYSSNDIVTADNWAQIVRFAKKGNPAVTESTHYANLNLLEDAIRYAEPMKPLFFTAEESVGIKFENSATYLATLEIEYSLNGTTWNDYTWGNIINLNTNEKCYFRGDNDTFSESQWRYVQFVSSGKVKAGGNVMSLLDSEMNLMIVPANAFTKLFQDSPITTAPELPATHIGDNGYYMMFRNCSELEVAPELPATVLSSTCYGSMFNLCTSLIEAPELPATSLPSSAYYGMFRKCASLVQAPELPATNFMSSSVYAYMFAECTSLIEAPELPATGLRGNDYGNMFNGCTALQTPPRLPATMLAGMCYENMFKGCTALSSLPKLPATTLPRQCYYGMFEGCTGIAINNNVGANTFRVPHSGTASVSDYAINYMFKDTSGDVTTGFAVDTTYKTNNAIIG